jgi:CAAX protease family protein
MPIDHHQWRSLGRALLFMIGCAAILAGISPLAPAGPGPKQEIFIGVLGSLGAACLTLLFVRWEGLRLHDVGASLDRRSLVRCALSFFIGLLIVALHTFILGVLGPARWVRAPAPSFATAALTLIGYLFLSMREELAFHGYPLRRLRQSFGLWPAQLVVASLFALEHIAGGVSWKVALMGVWTGSLLFGMAAIATKGLAVPIGLHAAWNLGDWMRGGKASPGIWRPIVEPGFEERVQLVGLASYVVVMALATLAFWWWYRHGRTVDESVGGLES